MAKFKVVKGFAVDGGPTFGDDEDSDLDGVDAQVVESAVRNGWVVPMEAWQAAQVETPVEAEPAPEAHPHHVGPLKPRPGTWEAIREEKKAARDKGDKE